MIQAIASLVPLLSTKLGQAVACNSSALIDLCLYFRRIFIVVMPVENLLVFGLHVLLVRFDIGFVLGLVCNIQALGLGEIRGDKDIAWIGDVHSPHPLSFVLHVAATALVAL